MDKIIEIFNYIKKGVNFVVKHKDLFLIGIIVLMFIFLMNQCSSNTKLKDEIQRQYNNELAMKDTLSQYVDELGRVNAEKHAYQLTRDELIDSIGKLDKKHREYISYLKSQLGIKDTVELYFYIDRPYRDTTKLDNGIIKVDTTDVFGNSSRRLYLSIPYDIDTILHLQKSTFSLEQNIFVEGWLERDNKNGETFVHLRSDYPGITFNDGTGFVAEPSSKYERSMRKTMGIGLFVGPSVGFGYTPEKWQPYVGLSVGIGLTFTPRILQW